MLATHLGNSEFKEMWDDTITQRPPDVMKNLNHPRLRFSCNN